MSDDARGLAPALQPHIPVPFAFVTGLLVFGAAGLAIAIGQPSPMVGIWPALLLAFVVVWRLHKKYRRAARVSVMMFSICAFVAGIAHIYSMANFGEFISLNDSETLYELSRVGLVPDTLIGLRLVADSPLAILVWRFAYEVAAKLALGDGIWIGLYVNAVLVALSAALGVGVVAMLFPADSARTKRSALLYFWCPMFWLFGAVLVRDSFALLLETMTLWAFVSMLQNPSRRSIFKYGVLIAGLTVLMAGIRLENALLTPVLGSLAGLSWALQHRGRRRIVALTRLGLIAGLIALPFAEQILDSGIKNQQYYLESAESESSSGLGYQLVVSQPAPIRLVAGSVYMSMFPIPVWAYFSLDSVDYHWLKSFSGMFMILLTPFAVLGVWRVMQRTSSHKPGTAPLTFVALCWVTMLVAVAMTSLETRHIGPFLPAFIILAVVPDPRQPRDRAALKKLGLLWFAFVVGVHALWLALH